MPIYYSDNISLLGSYTHYTHYSYKYYLQRRMKYYHFIVHCMEDKRNGFMIGTDVLKRLEFQ